MLISVLSRRLFIAMLPLFLGMFISSAFAEAFVPKMYAPDSFKAYLFGLEEVRKNIDTVQCGGWKDTDARRNGVNLTGTIPLPAISDDVPGRKNKDPLGSPETGIGLREEFAYPDSAWGYSSACDIEKDEIIDEDLAKLGKKITYDHDIAIDADPNVRVESGNGEIKINPGHWCQIKDDNYEKATPTWCKKLFEEVFKKMSELVDRENLRPTLDDACNCTPPAPYAAVATDCPPRPEKRYCFDTEKGPYTFECKGTSDTKTMVTTTSTDTPPQEKTCRTTWDTKDDRQFKNTMTRCDPLYADQFAIDGTTPIHYHVPVSKEGEHKAVSASFYRHYAESFMNPKITVTAPTQTWNVRVECYGNYKEVDPKFTVMSRKDEQCEIINATGDAQNPTKPEWPDGDIKQKEKVKADDLMVREADRLPKIVPDSWVADTESNINLINMKKFIEDQKKGKTTILDPISLFGTLLPTRQRASKTIEPSSRSDTFDDSDHRALAKFWEEQERELQKIIAVPRIKLLMPSRFFVGLADDDPLFQYTSGITAKSDGLVEVTLRAGLDDITALLLSLHRKFIAPVEEVRIPLIVPLASEADISARIFEWEQWKIAEDASKTDGRPSQATKADGVLSVLRGYRDRVRAVRDLRGTLAVQLEKLLEPEKKIRNFIADWYKKNAEFVVDARKSSEERQMIQNTWRTIQKTLLEADQCQLRWCSNQRYSVPVYSLLDPWWGDAKEGDSRNMLFTPTSLVSLNYDQPMDQSYDFSSMTFSQTGTLLPVLWPIAVPVELPPPPLVGGAPVAAEDLALLPELPGSTIFDSFKSPEVDLPPPSTLTVPTLPKVDGVMPLLQEYQKIADGMKAKYCGFIDSILITPDSTNEKYDSRPENRNHDDTKDEKGNKATIVHVEYDLRERIARLFSRWLPELTEDLGGRVVRLEKEGFKSGTKKCHENIVCYFLAPEHTSVQSWQWYVPTMNIDIDPLQKALKAATLPESDNQKNPYNPMTKDDLRRLFLPLALPVSIQLIAPTK